MNNFEDSLIFSVLEDADIQKTADIAKIIWREYYTPIIGAAQVSYMLENFQSMETMKRQIEKEDFLYFLIKIDDVDVGYLSLRFEQDNRCFLSKIYILKEYRKNGYARRALLEIENLCEEKEQSAIWLTVNIHNEASISAYKKMGFEIIDEKCADIGAGFFMDDYIMEKRLR